MSLNLSKGQKLDLAKTSVVEEDGSLKDIYFGAGWEAARAGDDFDLDVCVLAMQGNAVLETMYFGNKTSECGGVQLSDDNTTGEGDGDDEFINITAADLNPNFDRLVIGINIYQAKEKGQNFGLVDDAFMRVVNPENDEEIALFDLSFDADTSTGLVFGELIKRKDKWFFSAKGETFDGDLNDFVNMYNK